MLERLGANHEKIYEELFKVSTSVRRAGKERYQAQIQTFLLRDSVDINRTIAHHDRIKYGIWQLIWKNR